MMKRINIGCGQTPTPGWENVDNSFSIRLARIPYLAEILRGLACIDERQLEFIRFARKKDMSYGDAVKGLSLPSESYDVVYSSHVLEHLDPNSATRFLREAFRLLCPGGIIRIAVPDINIQVQQYLAAQDADAFIQGTLLTVEAPQTFIQKVRLLLVGHRHHQWMYDGASLSRLLQRVGYSEVEIMPVGTTKITEYEPLDLWERSSESVYVEAIKPFALEGKCAK